VRLPRGRRRRTRYPLPVGREDIPGGGRACHVGGARDTQLVSRRSARDAPTATATSADESHRARPAFVLATLVANIQPTRPVVVPSTNSQTGGAGYSQQTRRCSKNYLTQGGFLFYTY